MRISISRKLIIIALSGGLASGIALLLFQALMAGLLNRYVSAIAQLLFFIGLSICVLMVAHAYAKLDYKKGFITSLISNTLCLLIVAGYWIVVDIMTSTYWAIDSSFFIMISILLVSAAAVSALAIFFRKEKDTGGSFE